MFLKMIINQARQKWVVTSLLLLVMTCLITLYTYLRNSAQYTNRSMQLAMKQMGHNLIIIPDDVNAIDIYRCTEGQKCFSDEVTRKLAKHTSLASKYYVSVLQKYIRIKTKEIILTGIEPVKRPDETQEKGNPLKAVDKGNAQLGSEAARALNVSLRDGITIFGKEFNVSEIFKGKGSLDDFRIYLNLQECQSILKMEKKINCIFAFECLHGGSLAEVEKHQRAVLERILPGFRQITKMDIARGRYLARNTTQKYLQYLLMLICAATVIIIIITGLQEVRERKREVGLLLSIGIGYSYIISLYITKIVIIALFSSITGFLIGSVLSRALVTPFAVTSTRQVAVIWAHLPSVIILACLFAVAAEVVPMIVLVRIDPSIILMEE